MVVMSRVKKKTSCYKQSKIRRTVVMSRVKKKKGCYEHSKKEEERLL